MSVTTAEPPTGITTPDMLDLGADIPAELDTDWIPQPWTLPRLTAEEFSRAFPGGSLIADGIRGKIVREAMTWLGTPYDFGGNGRGGIDCSALIQQVYRAFGIELPRVSRDQANIGERIPLDQLQPGDLLGTDNSTRNDGADHIVMYIGNGQIIEAPRTGLSVRIRDILPDENWWGVSMASFL